MLTLGELTIEIEKVGLAMVREKAVLEVTFPDVPVMVNTVVPRATALLDERVRYTYRLVVPIRLAGFGEKEAVTPLGNPERERLTGPENPFAE